MPDALNIDRPRHTVAEATLAAWRKRLADLNAEAGRATEADAHAAGFEDLATFHASLTSRIKRLSAGVNEQASIVKEEKRVAALEAQLASRREPTPAEKALNGFRTRLAEQQAQLEKVRERIPGLFAQGGEPAVKKEQDQVIELEDDIRRTSSLIELQQRTVASEQQRALEAKLAAGKQYSRTLGDRVTDVARHMQVNLQERLLLQEEFRTAYDAFVASVGKWSDSILPTEFLGCIPNLITIAAFALSETGPRIALESAYELREQGKHQLPPQVEAHVNLILQVLAQPRAT